MARSLEDTTLSRSPSITPAPREKTGPSAYLVVISGPSFGEMYKLKVERSTLGRGDRADIRVLDDGVSREHAAIERDGGKMVLVDLGSTNGTFCNGTRVQRQDLTDGDKISIGATTILRFTYQDQVDEHYQKKLFESALRDGLTSTFNRRYFVDRLHTEIRFAVRHEKSLALLFVDIDHFKKINDEYGHLAGDEVLAGVARVMTATIRAEDVLARYGGEEFAVLFPETGSRPALAVADRVRRALERERFESEGKAFQVTVSAGVADTQELLEDERGQLLFRADKALYAAKDEGRNRARLWTDRRRAPRTRPSP
jgi:two-component system cell cycle response regulator